MYKNLVAKWDIDPKEFEALVDRLQFGDKTADPMLVVALSDLLVNGDIPAEESDV